MIDYIEGELHSLELDSCVISINGIGYKIYISSNTYSHLIGLNSVNLKINMNVKEDSITLYGFYTRDERTLYNHLISVSGIGPKVALNILSEFKVGEFISFIEKEDVKNLQRPVGIGKKSAERLLLELKDKVKKTPWEEIYEEEIKPTKKNVLAKIEAKEGLISLGYSESEANLALNILEDSLTVEELLKSSLQILAKRK